MEKLANREDFLIVSKVLRRIHSYGSLLITANSFDPGRPVFLVCEAESYQLDRYCTRRKSRSGWKMIILSRGEEQLIGSDNSNYGIIGQEAIVR